MRRRLLPSAAAALFAVALPAQRSDGDGVRRPTFARVEDKDGQPLAGAVVTFAGCVPHLGSEGGPRDLHEVLADARGRAQCKLLPGLCYVAWAVGPAGPGGERAVSAVQGWFGAGAMFPLRCSEPRRPTLLRVHGADAWQAQGPLRFVGRSCDPGPELALALDAEGRLEVPVGPARTIEVQTADGVPLLHADAAVGELVIPAPRPIRVRATDENGAPLAGAAVRLRVGRIEAWRQDDLGAVVQDRWRALGNTDAQGIAEVVVPYAVDPLQESRGNLALFVGTDERPSVAGGVLNGELYLNDARARRGEAKELLFVCKRVPPLAGSLGRVPKGTVVHLAAVCKLFTERTSYRHDARSYTAAVAADGSFAFADVPAELHACRLAIVPPDGTASAWPLFPTMRGRELPAEVQRGAVATAEAYGDLELQMLDASGGPARGLVVYVTQKLASGVLVRDGTVRVPLDARGAAALRLLPGAWVLTAWNETGYAARLLDVKTGSANESVAMQTLPVMQLELRDAAGKPIRGARVIPRGTTTRGTGDPLQSVLQSLRSVWISRWSALATDEQGRVAIPFVPVEGVSQKVGLVWAGGQTDELVVEANGDWRLLGPK